MQNFRVADLEKLSDESVTIVEDMESCEYGKSDWTLDVDGNKIELWKPVEKAFQ